MKTLLRLFGLAFALACLPVASIAQGIGVLQTDPLITRSFHNQGTWSLSNAYAQYDVVSVGGSLYYAPTAIAAGGASPVSNAAWVSLGGVNQARSVFFGKGAPCLHFGDSITAGYYAQPADGTGNVYSTHGYSNVLDAAVGWTCTNNGVSGSQLQDAAQIDTILGTTIAPNTISTILPGANDMRSAYCTGCSGGMNTTTAQLQFLSELEWAAIWMATPAANHALGTNCPAQPANPSCTFSSGWSASPAFGTQQTVTPGSSVTTYLVGSAIYISSLQQTSNSSTYSVTVDGSPVVGSPFNTLGYIPRTGNDTGRNYSHNVIRVGGLPETQHTVVLTCLTASTGNPCYFAGVASNGANSAGLQSVQTSGPNAYIGTTLRAQGGGYAAFGGSDTIVSQFNALEAEVVTELASDKLHVQLVDTSGVMNPNNSGLYWTDGFHPSTAGHAMIGQAFVSAITAAALPNDRGSAQILQGVNPCTLNGGFVVGGCPSAGLLRGQLGSVSGPVTGAVLMGADGGGLARTGASNYLLTNGSGAAPSFGAGHLQASLGDVQLGTDGGGIYRDGVNAMQVLGNSAGFNFMKFGGGTSSFPAFSFAGGSIGAVTADSAHNPINFFAGSFTIPGAGSGSYVRADGSGYGSPTGVAGPAGPTGPTGATGPQGPAGSLATATGDVSVSGSAVTVNTYGAGNAFGSAAGKAAIGGLAAVPTISTAATTTNDLMVACNGTGALCDSGVPVSQVGQGSISPTATTNIAMSALNYFGVSSLQACLHPYIDLACMGALDDAAAGSQVTSVAGSTKITIGSGLTVSAADVNKVGMLFGGTPLSPSVTVAATSITVNSSTSVSVLGTNAFVGAERVLFNGCAGSVAPLNGHVYSVTPSSPTPTTAGFTATTSIAVTGISTGTDTTSGDLAACVMTVMTDMPETITAVDTSTNSVYISVAPTVTAAGLYWDQGTDIGPVLNATAVYVASGLASSPGGKRVAQVRFPSGGSYLLATPVSLGAGNYTGFKGAGSLAKIQWAGANGAIAFTRPANAPGNWGWEYIQSLALSYYNVPSVWIDNKTGTDWSMQLNGNYWGEFTVAAFRTALGANFHISDNRCTDFSGYCYYLTSAAGGNRQSVTIEGGTVDFGTLTANRQGTEACSYVGYDNSAGGPQTGSLLTIAGLRVENQKYTPFCTTVTPKASAAYSATNAITVSSTVALIVGNTITDVTTPGAIPAGTTISSISGTNLTLSANVTGMLSGDKLSTDGSRLPGYIVTYITGGNTGSATNTPPTAIRDIAVNNINTLQNLSWTGSDDQSGAACPAVEFNNDMWGSNVTAFYDSASHFYCSSALTRPIVQPFDLTRQRYILQWPYDPGGIVDTKTIIGAAPRNQVTDSELGLGLWTVPTPWALGHGCGGVLNDRNCYQITGTGSASGSTKVSQSLPPTLAGSTVTLQGYCETVGMLAGVTGWNITGTGLTSPGNLCPANVFGTYATTIAIPAGATNLAIVLNTSNAVIPSGVVLSFSEPMVTIGGETYPYQPNLFDQVTGAIPGVAPATSTVSGTLKTADNAHGTTVSVAGLTGNYGDLSGAPSVAPATSTVSGTLKTADNAHGTTVSVAGLSGSYNDLTNLPSIPTGPIGSAIGGDLACAVAGDTTIGAQTVTASTSTSTTATFTMALVPQYFRTVDANGNLNAVIGTTGFTPTGYNVAQATVTAITGTTVTIALGTNPGTSTAQGTIFLACGNQTNNAVAATPYASTNGFAAPASYFNNLAVLDLTQPLMFWSGATSVAPAIQMKKGGTALYSPKGAAAIPASYSAVGGVIRTSLQGAGTSSAPAITAATIFNIPTTSALNSFGNTVIQPAGVNANAELVGYTVYFASATAGNAVLFMASTARKF